MNRRSFYLVSHSYVVTDATFRYETFDRGHDAVDGSAIADNHEPPKRADPLRLARRSFSVDHPLSAGSSV
jgi:hypothetical protein